MICQRAMTGQAIQLAQQDATGCGQGSVVGCLAGEPFKPGHHWMRGLCRRPSTSSKESGDESEQRPERCACARGHDRFSGIKQRELSQGCGCPGPHLLSCEAASRAWRRYRGKLCYPKWVAVKSNSPVLVMQRSPCQPADGRRRWPKRNACTQGRVVWLATECDGRCDGAARPDHGT